MHHGRPCWLAISDHTQRRKRYQSTLLLTAYTTSVNVPTQSLSHNQYFYADET